LREIRAGEKAGGYPIATIKAAVVWLIESYAEAVVAPAPEAALLVSEIMGPTPANAASRVMKQYQNQYQSETVDRFGEATQR